MPDRIRINIEKTGKSKDLILIDPPIHTDQELAYSVLDDNLRGQEIPKGAHGIANYLQQQQIGAVVLVTDPFLKTKKYQVENQEELVKKMEKLVEGKIDYFNPEVVALNLMYTFTEPTVVEMSRFVKDRYPEKLLVVGGNHATFSADFLLDPRNKTGIDVVVRGEGEWTMEQLMRGVKDGQVNLAKIDGLSYFDKADNKVKHNKPRGRGELQSIPPLDYALIHMPEEVNILGFNHTVMFARACRGNCSFCTSPEMWGRKVTNISVDNFRHEIDFLVKNGVKFISVLDDDLLVTDEVFRQMSGVMTEIKADNSQVNFWVQTRVASLRKEQERKIKTMMEAGVKRLYLGLESGSTEILREMRKGYKREWVESVLSGIKNYCDGKLEVGVFWMFGHPGANKKTEEESIRFLEGLLKEGLIDDVEIHNTVPFPGTAVSRDPRVKVFDHDLKHYGFMNNYPVYDLIDPDDQDRVILSAKDIFEFQQRALKLREEYLGVDTGVANKPNV